MASLGGSVDFPRMKQQLRQLFHHPKSVTKEDVFSVAEELQAHSDEDLSYEAWLASRKQQKQPAGAGIVSRSPFKKGNGKKQKASKGGQELNGLNRRTGERNRRYGCGSEYHLLPKCPTKMGKRVSAPIPPVSSTPRSSFSSITLEDSPQDVNSVQHSFSSSLTKDRPVF